MYKVNLTERKLWTPVEEIAFTTRPISTPTPKCLVKLEHILSATSAHIFRFLWFMPSLVVRVTEATLKLKPFPHSYLYWKLHKCNISLICQRQERAATLQLYEVVEGFFLDSSFYAIQLKSLMPQKSCKEEVFFSFWYYTST